MKIIQLIDSLDAGGAERMAVSYANVLAQNLSFSGLIATRNEGLLKDNIVSEVNYLFLEKKSILDINAIKRLYVFIKQYKITHIHAHSSSFFLAVLIKIFKPSLKIVWHDHYGKSEFLKERPKIALQICSFFFHCIIVVNEKLKQWSSDELYCKKIFYLPNFPILDENQKQTILKGENGKKIVLLANLREQKNISFMLEVASAIKEKYPDWTFHIVGKRFKDSYENRIIQEHKEMKLEETVYFYDSCPDIKHILSQAQIGILTSNSEGLPVSILEYGMMNLPVIATNVGQIPEIIVENKNGLLTAVNDVSSFAYSIEKLIVDKELRIKFGSRLNETINNKFSSKAVIDNYLDFVR